MTEELKRRKTLFTITHINEKILKQQSQSMRDGEG
jgi:hypothetical protein